MSRSPRSSSASRPWLAGNGVDMRAISLGTTALHQLYLRLSADPAPIFEQQALFFAQAAQAMRHQLCDRARNRQLRRARGDWIRVNLDDKGRNVALESAGRNSRWTMR